MPGVLAEEMIKEDPMTVVEELREKLGEIEKITDQEWQASLDDRKKKEIEFHDRDRERSRRENLASTDKDTFERFYGNRKYYSATQTSNEYVNRWIATQAKGKVFLDYACGNGKNAIAAAKAGAALAIGLDISPVSVEICKEKAREAGVTSNTHFVQADAENTLLPPNSVDAILCSGMLHHLDLSYAFPELRRILAPGGKILAVEALDYNPLIKLYRMMTPQMRTEWEKAHILSLKDVGFAKRFFQTGEIRYWHITSILSPHLKFLEPLFNGVDKALTKVPWVQRMAWIFTFELIKPAS